jgi:hypothetical protein
MALCSLLRGLTVLTGRSTRFTDTRTPGSQESVIVCADIAMRRSTSDRWGVQACCDDGAEWSGEAEKQNGYPGKIKVAVFGRDRVST